MYSAMRMKKRYIVFKTSAPVRGEDMKTGLYSFLLKFFGEYGYSKLGYKLLQYDERQGLGLIRCERSSLHDLLGSLALIENLNGKKVRTISLASSGTIKTLREKFDFIKEKED